MAHIVKSFDDALDHLHGTLTGMGTLADGQFEKALEVLIGGDHVLAKQVVDGDQEVDRLEEAVNEQVIRLLALRSPMADDLRLVVSALKVAGDLERIADYAANIARRAQMITTDDTFPSLPSVNRIGRLVHRQLALVLQALSERSAEKATAVWTDDQQIDEAYAGLFRELLTYMMENPRNIGPCSHLLFIAKNMERIGDHATNIAEMVYFLATGHQIDGERPKSDDSTSVA